MLPSFLPSAGQHNTLDTNEETGTNAKAGDQQPLLTLAGFSKGGLLYCGPAMLHACILTVSKSSPGTGLGELSYTVSVESEANSYEAQYSLIRRALACLPTEQAGQRSRTGLSQSGAEHQAQNTKFTINTLASKCLSASL